jgi:hypothetical protein
VTQLAGRPHDIVAALIEAANDAGGKDNVTVVYVEGELFAATRTRARRSAAARDTAIEARTSGAPARTGHDVTSGRAHRTRRALAAVTTLALLRWRPSWPVAAPTAGRRRRPRQASSSFDPMNRLRRRSGERSLDRRSSSSPENTASASS